MKHTIAFWQHVFSWECLDALATVLSIVGAIVLISLVLACCCAVLDRSPM